MSQVIFCCCCFSFFFLVIVQEILWSEYCALCRWNLSTDCSTWSLKSGRFCLANINARARNMIHNDNLTSSLILCPLKPTPWAVGNSFNRSNLLQTHETIAFSPRHHIFSPAILTEWMFEVVTLSKCDQKPECMPSGSLWKLHVLYMKMTFFLHSFFPQFPLIPPKKLNLLVLRWYPMDVLLLTFWTGADGRVCNPEHLYTCAQPELKSTPQCVCVCGGGSVKVIFVHHVSQADESSRDNPPPPLPPSQDHFRLMKRINRLWTDHVLGRLLTLVKDKPTGTDRKLGQMLCLHRAWALEVV